MLDLLETRSLAIISHIDGPLLPEVYSEIKAIEKEVNLNLTSLSDAVEKMMVRVIEEGLPLDELVLVIENVNEFLVEGDTRRFFEAMDEAIAIELAATPQIISEMDSHEELDEHIDYLKVIGRLTSHDPGDAIDSVQRHMEEVGSSDNADYSPLYENSSAQGDDKFTDADVKSLFSGLVS